MLNRDRMNMVDARLTIQTAYAALSGAQSHPPEQQVMAYATLFYEACIGLNLDPSEMLDKARRLRSFAKEHMSLELRPLEDYIRKELNK